jgi:transposase InsO family protein
LTPLLRGTGHTKKVFESSLLTSAGPADKAKALIELRLQHNGEIIAYATQEKPRMPLVSGMLTKALSKLDNGEAPMLHSLWHGREGASHQRQLASRGLTQSISRKGNRLDNAAMVSFFGTLKSEYFYLNKFENVKELEMGLKEYIHYNNNDRIKTNLKGLSPVQYRTQPSMALSAS